MVGPTCGVGANCSWSSPEVRAVAIGSRAQSEPFWPKFPAASDRQWECEEGSTPRPLQRPATVVRERKTPEQVRSDPPTKMSRLQAALKSLGDGDVEEKRALESALLKAQKQAEEMPAARQIEVTKDFIFKTPETRRSTTCAKFRWPKDVSNVSKRRLYHFVKPHQCPRRSEIAFPIGPDGFYQRRMWPSPTAKFNPSSSRVGGEGCQTECWSVRTRSEELRVAIEDRESILSLADLIHRGAAQNQMFPSMVTNVVSA